MSPYLCYKTASEVNRYSDCQLTIPLGPSVLLMRSPMAMAPTNDDCLGTDNESSAPDFAA